ncbi:MAG TPA: hypothetical protein VMU50_05920, partial [Polyangia bacterium]|nr:hypothetical protein [Polyangia bacterium]
WYYPLAGGAGGVGVATSGPVAAALTATTPASGVDAMSDRLLIFDLGASTFASLYDQPTGMYNSDLVGEHDGRMLMNLQGDGFLVVDVSNPAAPNGVRFVRTLGWANNIEFSGDDVYIASGYYGLQHFALTDAPALLATAMP